MIKPTIGRVVLYRHSASPKEYAAIVADVHSDELITICAFDHNGIPSPVREITLWQGEGAPPTHPYCEWMPYQKGQAAKTELLEGELAKHDVRIT
jgi:hypothetical protein